MTAASDISIVTVDRTNIADHPQTICFINPKHPSYSLKVNWLEQRFAEGLIIKLIYLQGEKRPVGFIEYLPGEQCWRAVHANRYLFIHCVWVNAVKNKRKGLGSLLIDACEKDAKTGGFAGVAVMTSSGAFMADKALFEKNGFHAVAKDAPYELMVKKFHEAPDPYFKDWRSELKKYQGLHMIYSMQCPWVGRFVMESAKMLRSEGIELSITELQTASQAQSAPSPYAVFNLVHNGKLLADHYISETRFKNILAKLSLP